MDEKRGTGGSDNNLSIGRARALNPQQEPSMKNTTPPDEENGFRFRELFETMSLGVVYQDAKGRIIAANPAAEMILGVTIDQMMGRTSKDPRWRAISEDGQELPGDRHPAMVALRTGKRVSDFIMGVFNPAMDQVRWISVDATPFFKKGANLPYRVYTTFRDISDLRQTMKSLSESEERYRTLVTSIEDLVFVNDHENVFREYFGADTSFLYTTPECFMGKRIDEVLPIDVATLFIEKFDEIRKSDVSQVFDYALEINGNLKWFSARLSLHKDGRSVVSVVRDVTDRVIAERELRRSQNELEVYASLLRHDLGSDLQIIISQIELAESILTIHTDEAMIFESIKAITQRMANLLKSVGLPTDDYEETLEQMLSRVANLSQIAHSGLTIEIDISDELARDKSIHGLRLLPTVFDNLFRNAAEHAGRDVVVKVSAWNESDIICIKVQDNGPGISDDVKANLFQRGASTRGGGLGLYLSSNIIKAYNGYLRFEENNAESGACFIVGIPR